MKNTERAKRAERARELYAKYSHTTVREALATSERKFVLRHTMEQRSKNTLTEEETVNIIKELREKYPRPEAERADKVADYIRARESGDKKEVERTLFEASKLIAYCILRKVYGASGEKRILFAMYDINKAYSFDDTIGEGMDIVQEVALSLIEKSDMDLMKEYVTTELSKRVYIQRSDGQKNKVETRERKTTPIQEVYRQGRRYIQNNRNFSADTNYMYFSELVQVDTNGEAEPETVYLRLRSGEANGVSRYGEYSIRHKREVEIIKAMNLTPSESITLALRLRGYGYKAIARYRGVTQRAIAKCVKNQLARKLNEVLPHFVEKAEREALIASIVEADRACEEKANALLRAWAYERIKEEEAKRAERKQEVLRARHALIAKVEQREQKKREQNTTYFSASELEENMREEKERYNYSTISELEEREKKKREEQRKREEEERREKNEEQRKREEEERRKIRVSLYSPETLRKIEEYEARLSRK